MAGLGEACSHIAAVLFKIEAAVRLAGTSAGVSSDYSLGITVDAGPSPEELHILQA